MAIHSSILVWRTPWTETGRLQSPGSQRVGHDWATNITPLYHSLPQGDKLTRPPCEGLCHSWIMCVASGAAPGAPCLLLTGPEIHIWGGRNHRQIWHLYLLIWQEIFHFTPPMKWLWRWNETSPYVSLAILGNICRNYMVFLLCYLAYPLISDP